MSRSWRTPRDSQIIPVRLVRQLIEQMDAAVASLKIWGKSGRWRSYWYGWTRSSFIAAAIREKLAKMERSRKPHRKKAVAASSKV